MILGFAYRGTVSNGVNKKINKKVCMAFNVLMINSLSVTNRRAYIAYTVVSIWLRLTFIKGNELFRHWETTNQTPKNLSNDTANLEQDVKRAEQ